MVNLHQVKCGIAEFLDNEVIPHLSGVKRYGATVYLALAMDGAENKLQELMHHPLIAMLCVQDENGEIDIDRIHAVMTSRMKDEKLPVDIPMLGTFSFNRLDLDRLQETIYRQPRG